MQRLLMASLGKGAFLLSVLSWERELTRCADGNDLPELPSDFSILDSLKERIELAKKIESAMHKATKEAHEDNWVKQAAEAMDIEIDSDMECVPSSPRFSLVVGTDSVDAVSRRERTTGRSRRRR